MRPIPSLHPTPRTLAGPARVRLPFALVAAVAVLLAACSSGGSSSPTTSAPAPSTTGRVAPGSRPSTTSS